MWMWIIQKRELSCSYVSGRSKNENSSIVKLLFPPSTEEKSEVESEVEPDISSSISSQVIHLHHSSKSHTFVINKNGIRKTQFCIYCIITIFRFKLNRKYDCFKSVKVGIIISNNIRVEQGIGNVDYTPYVRGYNSTVWQCFFVYQFVIDKST